MLAYPEVSVEFVVIKFTEKLTSMRRQFRGQHGGANWVTSAWPDAEPADLSFQLSNFGKRTNAFTSCALLALLNLNYLCFYLFFHT